MQNSPFIYGKTVSSKSFINREAVLESLKINLLSGINTLIISPRRWGKTSLVEKAISEINRKEKNIRTVHLDLFSASNEAEFLEMFAKEVIKASASKWQEWISNCKSVFKNLSPRISLGIDPQTDFSIGFDWNELKKFPDEILNLPEILAKKNKFKMIICLDEFQNLSSFPAYESLEKKMRAVWQRQKQVTYCLYGSKRHMMTDIFNNPSKPFYRFGDIILLQKIETSKWIKFICKSFANTDKSIKESDAEFLVKLMKNHSWYVQQLAQYTWNQTSKQATSKEIEKALAELIQANTPFYQKEVESISITQLNLLKAIAKNETKFTSTSVMQQYQLGTPRNVSKNKVVLLKNDLVDLSKGVYEFLDPAFELWFRKQYFNQPYQLKK